MSDATTTQRRRDCPVCGGATTPVVTVPDVPALANAFAETEHDAASAARGDIDLVVCTCGMLHNASFDDAIAPYGVDYENSLHFSPRFQEHAEHLASRLAATYAVPDGTVLEIGSGAGDFLAMVASRGFARGIGLDPSLDEERDDTAGEATLSFVRSTLADAPVAVRADLVVCRHVLEHVSEPVAFLREAHQHVVKEDGSIYVEVPDATHMLQAPAIWDLVYEHVGYFTEPALVAALGAAGWTVTATGTSFGGQFLWAEAGARPVAAHRAGSGAGGGAGAEVADLAAGFGEAHARTMDRWGAFVADRADQRVAVWGAGSKGVSFLNFLRNEGIDVSAVIDVNPRKQGRFVPGTGHRVDGPEVLKQGIDTILLMNPLYVDEVEKIARGIGVTAPVVAVEG